MGERRVGEHGDVVTRDERRQVGHRGHHPVVVRRDEVRFVRAEVRPADPHLLGPPPACTVRVGTAHQDLVDREHGCGREVVRQRRRCRHRRDVADHLLGVGPAATSQLGLGDGTARGRQFLYPRARRGLRAQEHRGERSDLTAHLGVEASDLGRGVAGQRCVRQALVRRAATGTGRLLVGLPRCSTASVAAGAYFSAFLSALTLATH